MLPVRKRGVAHGQIGWLARRLFEDSQPWHSPCLSLISLGLPCREGAAQKLMGVVGALDVKPIQVVPEGAAGEVQGFRHILSKE